MAKPEHTDTPSDLLPDLPNYDPEPADGVRVGESPVPGLTLKRILRGHTDTIHRIAWSPDGRFLATPSRDKTTRIWDVAHGECIAVLEGQKGNIFSIAWSPDGHRLALGESGSSGGKGNIYIWDAETKRRLHTLSVANASILSLVWTQDGHYLILGVADRSIRWLEVRTGKLVHTTMHPNKVSYGLNLSPDGKRVAASLESNIWIGESNSLNQLKILKGHKSTISDLAWRPNTNIMASGSIDNTIGIWDTVTGKSLSFLEGHTNSVGGVAFSPDGRLLASKALRSTIRLWYCDTWQTLAEFDEQDTTTYATGLAFHPYLLCLATLGEKDTVIRIWDLDMGALLGQTAVDSIRYTTAKLVLVGDSGVGKTGLGWRLAHGAFKEHASTHGQQFWVVDDLCTTRADGTECEAVLWDLAGQHIYRPIHAIFLDDVNASLVLFDPTNRQEPLKGAEFWLEQLAHKKKLPPPSW